MPIDYDIIGALDVTPVGDSNFLSGDGSTWRAGFILASTSNLNVILKVDPQNEDRDGDADLRVYQDTNNNSKFDSSIDRLIGSSTRSGNSDESINLKSVDAGNYIVEAYQFKGNNINISLRLSTATISNLLPTEFEADTLVGTQTFTGSVGSTNTADVYHFSVDTARDFSLSLTGLSADADVRLIKDTNTSEIDLSQVIGSSVLSGNASESITASLEPGDYFVQVYQYNGDTDYTLGLTA